MAFQDFIPNSLTKIVLINNRLQAESISNFFKSLALLKTGPEVVALVRNSLDAATIEPACNYLKSQAAQNLKQFIIKDPTIYSQSNLGNEALILALPRQG